MTSTITIVQRTGQAGIRGFAQVVGKAIGARSERIAAQTRAYHERGAIGGQDLGAETRVELALRWHARHGRAL